jgi:hypothetical protein
MASRATISAIEQCDGSSAEVAYVASRILNGKYLFCRNSVENVWYGFNGTIWKRDESPRIELSRSVRDHFTMTVSQLRRKPKTEEGYHNERRCKLLMDVAQDLQDRHFMDRVLHKMSVLMSDPNFRNSRYDGSIV